MMDELKPGELTDVQKADVLEKLIPEIEGGLNMHYYELAALRRAVVVLRRPAPENKPRLLDTIHDLRNENARLRTEIERMRNAAPENKPLTLDQLRRMDGQPVWWWNKSHAPVCTICIARFNEVSFVDFDYSHDDSTGIVKYERWVKWGFKPYTRKPEQEATT